MSKSLVADEEDSRAPHAEGEFFTASELNANFQETFGQMSSIHESPDELRNV